MFTSKNIKILFFNFPHTPYTTPLPSQVIPYMDLTYLLAGEMEYYINGEHVLLHAGDAILFPPGSTRQRLFTDKPVHYASFNIQLHELYESPVCGHVSKCIQSNTAYFLSLFHQEWQTFSANKEDKCIALFSYLFYQLTEIACDQENPHIKSMKQYIINNLSRELPLEEIADAIHLSPNYCSTIFKKQTGISLMHFILLQRLDLAKRLIITTDQPLNVISEKCGFGDYNYFSHAFKKQVGMTATQYKNEKQKNLITEILN